MKIGDDINLSYFVRSRPDDEVLAALREKPELAQDRTLFPISCLRDSSAVAKYLITHGDISAINQEDRDVKWTPVIGPRAGDR